MATATYWVYVLVNRTGRLYIGLTDDVERRLADHNAGRSKWTSKFGPWERVWQYGPVTLKEARGLENLMKRQKGDDGLLRLMQARCSSGS